MKKDLPVILLKIIVLPHNELKFEIDGALSKSIIDTAEMFHDNKVIIVSQIDPLEETPTISDLPKMGVIAKITHKIELPNGKIRLTLKTQNRARVFEYLNQKSSGIFEAIVEEIMPVDISISENDLLMKKLSRDVENYINMVPYISNSFINQISKTKSLSDMTDIIAQNLPVDFKRLFAYLLEISPVNRMEMILEDIYKEIEMVNIENELDNKVRNELEDTQREYILKQKIKYMKEELGEVSLKEEEVKELIEKVENLNLPNYIKVKLEKEIRRYEALPSTSPELSMASSYINWLLELPWTNKTEDNVDLKKARAILDESHYGIEEVKVRIIEYLAVKEITNSLNGPVICLVGPPGVGKTSLASSIAKAMNRNFVKISVGGVHDEAEIRGHRRTYLGSCPGRIISGMKKAGCINPVFLIDEIDKMTSDIKGDPASALLEVLDPEQNSKFSDNYIEEEYDLSNVMFILTANNAEDIPEALRDRLEIINLSGYTEYEKLDISKKYLLPRIIKEHGIVKSNITFTDEALYSVIRRYTKEAGVRELNRQLSKVIRKIVTSIVTTKIKVSKLNITNDNLKAYLGTEKYSLTDIKIDEIGVVNGLCYTNYGGDVLKIEVNHYKGTGKINLTGSLGDVMKESANIALSYIKANNEKFGIDYEIFDKIDIHIHVPEGATPKEGPSAGIALTTALISELANIKVDNKIAMTGEITLRGLVLPIGGLKEKCIGAHRSNIKTIFIPFDNQKDLEKLPSEIINDIKFIPVKTYDEIFKQLKGELKCKNTRKKSKLIVENV